MVRYRWQLRALLMAGVAGVLGIAWNLVVGAHTSANERVMPEVASVGSYLAIVPLALIFYLLYGLIRRVWPELPRRGDKLRYAALYAFAAAFSIGVALALVATHPDFPLGPALADQAPSPDGSKTGYVYRRCLLGGHFDVFVRDSGELTLHRVESISRPSCEDARVHWVGNGEPEAVDSDGHRLVDAATPPMHLNLGPR